MQLVDQKNVMVMYILIGFKNILLIAWSSYCPL